MRDFLYFLAAFAVFIAAAKFVLDLRMRKHRGVCRKEFVETFSGLDIPTEIPEAVHDYYKRMVMFKSFGVAPDDTLEELHKGEEDIDDDTRFLMKKLGLKLPPEEVRRQWAEQRLSARAKPLLTVATDPTRWTQPIQTLRDMVLWLDFVRQHQNVVSRK